MIKKNEYCLYCGEKMESKSAKRKFCSDIHRVYYNREKKRGTLTPMQKKYSSREDIEKEISEIKAKAKPSFVTKSRWDTYKSSKISELKKHPSWQIGDAAEGTPAFFMKYGVYTYDEIKNK